MWFIAIPQWIAFYVSFVLATEAAAALSPRLMPRGNPITVPIHSFFSRAENGTVSGAQNGTTTLAGLTSVTMSSDKQSYFAVVTVGNINFRVALDTASADLWILSSNCQTNVCKNLPRYPLAYHSSTFTSVNNNETVFSAGYADGTFASGFLARESIQLSNLTIPNQTFAVVTDSNVTFTDQTSGIMGLGFPRLSSFPNTVTNSTPFFANLAQQGLLDYPLFALSLTRNDSGTLALGAIDVSVVKNTSLISWHPVAEFPPFGAESNTSSYLHWATPLSGFSVNGTEIIPIPTYPDRASNNSLALFDVGTSGIYGPYPDVTRLFALIDGARLVDDGQWAIPCDTVVPMAFAFGHQNYTLQPSDYLIGPVSGNPNLCLSWPRALPPNSDGIDWQIGTAFLRTVYSIFSFGINKKEAPMIGLYPLTNATNGTETPSAVASILSSLSATVATTLPNFLLPTPTFSTPAYALNTSVSASIGGIATAGLATSTYVPIVGQATSFNTSAIPTIVPTPTLATLVITDPSGRVSTTVSTHSLAAVTLGVPPGYISAGTDLCAPYFASVVLSIVLWTLLS